MRRTIAGAFLLFALSSEAALPQGALQFSNDYQPVISDLNVITPYLAREKLTVGDVTVIASVTCTTMRVANRGQLFERVRVLLNERYPPAREIEIIKHADFLNFEVDQFKKLGATPQTAALVSQFIGRYPTIPSTSPAQGQSLREQTNSAERIACELRSSVGTDLAGPASVQHASLAKSLGWIALSAGVMVVDGYVVVQFPGTPTTVLGIASGGWAWNRIEEYAKEIIQIWNSQRK